MINVITNIMISYLLYIHACNLEAATLIKVGQSEEELLNYVTQKQKLYTENLQELIDNCAKINGSNTGKLETDNYLYYVLPVKYINIIDDHKYINTKCPHDNFSLLIIKTDENGLVEKQYKEASNIILDL